MKQLSLFWISLHVYSGIVKQASQVVSFIMNQFLLNRISWHGIVVLWNKNHGFTVMLCLYMLSVA